MTARRCYNGRHLEAAISQTRVAAGCSVILDEAAKVDFMNDNTRWTIICPCCEATLIIDADTGAIISHQEKSKPIASFDDMKKDLERQKEVRNQVFAQELGSLKDRERLLDEKFREAMKRADKDKDKPFRNPLDMD